MTRSAHRALASAALALAVLTSAAVAPHGDLSRATAATRSVVRADGTGNSAGAGHERAVRAAGIRRTPPREMWVWHVRNVAHLLKVAHRARVTTLLVWVSPRFSSDARLMHRLRQLHHGAAVAGIRVQALCGDVSWLDEPQVARSWAREAARTRLFSGLHLDVEPQSLPNWQSAQAALGHKLLRTISATRAAGLPVEVDIPAWFNNVRIHGVRLDRAVLTRSAGICVMAYQNTADRVLAAATAEVREAQRLHKYAFIGVNLAPTGGDAPSTTMLGQPAKQIAGNLHAIAKRATRIAGYRGLALHDAAYVARLGTSLTRV